MLLDRFRRRLLTVAAETHPSTVLDAGCGEGFVTQWLQTGLAGAAVSGVDLHEAALDRARARVPEAAFERGDVTALPFADGAFDLVVCTEVLEHLDDPRAALAELRRVAGGRVLVTVPHEPWFSAGNLLRGRHLRRLGSTPGHRHRWTRGAFRRVAGGEWFGAFPWQGALV
jgi:ubiquinone/menaquinone biosynthesis C-methylase UbiE